MNWQVQKIEFLLAEHPIMMELEIIILILEHFQIMYLMKMDFLEQKPGGYKQYPQYEATQQARNIVPQVNLNLTGKLVDTYMPAFTKN
jgi:hypothetical protein